MRVPLSWLSELVVTDLGAEAVAAKLTMAGIEVARVEGGPAVPAGVVTARVLDVAPHPNAEKLSVCRVDDGSGERRIVCGARNMRAGDAVALALAGVTLPGGLTLGESEIRGVVSQGMMCSEKELGLGDDHDGILILPPGTEPGRPLADVLGGSGPVLELELTPNRSDCLSMIGVAREVSALTGAVLCGPAQWREDMTVAAGPVAGVAGAEECSVDVRIEEPAACPRYAARVFRGVRIGPSPAWMAARLQACGVRPINNVVDCTNYVMLELGQPLHAFDLRDIGGGLVRIRRARDGEAVRTLDGIERTLDPSDLVIADAEGFLALAGVMGGEGSAVKDDTVDLFLESATFDPVSVRRTARRLGLRTESSHRFERGVDPCLPPLALDRLAELLALAAGGGVVGGAVDLRPRAWRPPEVTLRPDRFRALLGIPLDPDWAGLMLSADGFHVRVHTAEDGGLRMVCTPASSRPDIERDVDVVEEVARLHGYDRVPATLPWARVQPVPEAERAGALARQVMTRAGFCEVVNYAFGSREILARLGIGEDDPRARGVVLRNPIRDDLYMMRTMLLPSLLENARANVAMRRRDLRLYELRHVFFPQPPKRKPGVPPAREERRLCALWTGRAAPEGWGQAARDADFFDLKGVLEDLLAELGARGVVLDAAAAPSFLLHGQAAGIVRGREDLGFIGRIDPVVARRWELDAAPWVLDLAFDRLGAGGRRLKFQAASRFPAAERDLAVVAPDSVPASALVADVEASGGPHLAAVTVADVYRGEPIPSGSRSILLRLVFQSAVRTLTEAEVTAAVGAARERLEARPGVGIRDR